MVDKNKLYELAARILEIDDGKLKKEFMELTSILNKEKDDSYNIPKILVDTYEISVRERLYETGWSSSHLEYLRKEKKIIKDENEIKKDVISYFKEAYSTFIEEVKKLKENKNTKYHSDIFSLIRDDIFKTDSYHGSSIRFYPICLEMFFDKYSTEFMKNKLKEYKTKLNTEGNMYKPEAEDIVLQLQLMEQSK